MAEKKRSEKPEIRRIYKSRKDRIIDGVCAGVADYFGADATVIRVLWLLSVLISGLGLVAYILGMIIIPVNPDHKNLKKGEMKQRNPAFFWGAILIVAGFFFLYQRWDTYCCWDFPGHFPFFRFWHVPWGTLWPLILVFLGIFYIVHSLKKEEKPKDKETKGVKGRSEEKKLVRTKDSKIVGGVCGGMGRYFGIDATLVRIGFVFFALLTNVFLWIVLYIVLLIVIPVEKIGDVVSD